MKKSKDNCTAMIVGKKATIDGQLSLHVMKTVMVVLMKSFLSFMKLRIMMKTMYQSTMV